MGTNNFSGYGNLHIMKKIAAVLQIILVLFLVAYGTYHLFLGNFEVSMVTVPLLIGYYLLMVSLKKKSE